MHRLALALALLPIAFASTAMAQTASPDAVKTLWCGEAFAALDLAEKPQVTPDLQANFDAFVAAANKLVDNGTQGYLDAGFTEEQVTKIKADLVTEVTGVVTQNQQGKFTPDDCNPLLHAVLVLPSSSEAAPSDASSADTSSAPMSEMSSSSAPAASDSASSSAAQ